MPNLETAKSVTFVDVETTSLDSTRSAILQIAIITDWDNGKQDVWETKIKPRDLELRFADKQALEVCKYSKEEWEDAPSFEDIAKTIAKKLVWGPIVGHNIQFDIDHIVAAFKRRNWKSIGRNDNIYGVLESDEKKYKIGYPLIDTCALAFLFTPSDRQNLNALRDHFGIDTNRAHDAGNDVEDCRTVFYNILNMKLSNSA